MSLSGNEPWMIMFIYINPMVSVPSVSSSRPQAIQTYHQSKQHIHSHYQLNNTFISQARATHSHYKPKQHIHIISLLSLEYSAKYATYQKSRVSSQLHKTYKEWLHTRLLLPSGCPSPPSTPQRYHIPRELSRWQPHACPPTAVP